MLANSKASGSDAMALGRGLSGLKAEEEVLWDIAKIRSITRPKTKPRSINLFRPPGAGPRNALDPIF